MPFVNLGTICGRMLVSLTSFYVWTEQKSYGPEGVVEVDLSFTFRPGGRRRQASFVLTRLAHGVIDQ